MLPLARHGRKGGIGLRSAAIQPLNHGLCHAFQILVKERILHSLAIRWDDVAHLFPNIQQLKTALEEQFPVQHPGLNERRQHLPIAGNHQVVGMSLGTQWAKGLELIHRGSLERLCEPAASLAQFLFAPYFVEPQNQIDVVMCSLRFHNDPPILSTLHPMTSVAANIEVVSGLSFLASSSRPSPRGCLRAYPVVYLALQRRSGKCG